MNNVASDAFYKLGQWIQDFLDDRGDPSGGGDFSAFRELIAVQHHHHAWLTPRFINHSLRLLGNYLVNPTVSKEMEFISSSGMYRGGKTISIIPDENLPLSGFNELMFSVIAGHSVVISNKNRAFDLLKQITHTLVRLEPACDEKIHWTEKYPASTNAWIFVSDKGNSSLGRYFSQRTSLIYPAKISLAVLTGHETPGELSALADDVFIFWGLAPANVRKLLIPRGYDFSGLFQAFEKYSDLYQNNRYANHYDYHRSVFLMEQKPFLDNGFILLLENDSVKVPPGVVHYGFYSNPGEIGGLFNHHDIFSVVSTDKALAGNIKPGMSLPTGYFQGWNSRLMSFLQSL